MSDSLLLKGYDLTTGEERWSVSRVTHVACTTPVLGDGLLFFAGWAPGKGYSTRSANESYQPGLVFSTNR